MLHANGKQSRILIVHWMKKQQQYCQLQLLPQQRHIRPQHPPHPRLQILQRLQLQQLQQKLQQQLHQQRRNKYIPRPQLNWSGIKTQDFMNWSFLNFQNQRIQNSNMARGRYLQINKYIHHNYTILDPQGRIFEAVNKTIKGSFLIHKSLRTNLLT